MLSHLKKFLFSLTRFAAFVFVLSVGVTVAMDISGASPAAFARPLETLATFPIFFSTSGHLADIEATVYRTLQAFLIAVFAGILVGVTSARTPVFRVESELLIDFLRSIPATALVPVFLVIFGTGDTSKIAVGAFSGGLALAITVVVGFRGLDEDRARIADMIGLRGFSRLWFYQLPEIAPTLFVGLRTAASLSLILVIVAEMFIGSENGIGRVIMDYRYSDGVPNLYAAIAISGILGFSFNQILLLLELAIRRGNFMFRSRVILQNLLKKLGFVRVMEK